MFIRNFTIVIVVLSFAGMLGCGNISQNNASSFTNGADRGAMGSGLSTSSNEEIGNEADGAGRTTEMQDHINEILSEANNPGPASKSVDNPSKVNKPNTDSIIKIMTQIDKKIEAEDELGFSYISSWFLKI